MSSLIHRPCARAETASPAAGIGYGLRQRARARRASSLRAIIAAVIHAARVLVRQARIRHQQRRQASVTCAALRGLDDRTLHDLGFDRGEIRSVAAEMTGEAEATRIRASTSLGSSRTTVSTHVHHPE